MTAGGRRQDVADRGVGNSPAPAGTTGKLSGGWDGAATVSSDGGSTHNPDSNAFPPTWIDLDNIEYFLD